MFDGTENQDIYLARIKSNFIPPSKRNVALDECINTRKNFNNYYPKQGKNNLTLQEQEALKILKTNSEIII